MTAWRKQAEQAFPELGEIVSQAESPYLLWDELVEVFKSAYGAPRNESLILRIYRYGDWCIDQEQTEMAETDLTTCVAVSFFEEIPRIPEARADMPRWFTLEDFLGMKELFCYYLSEEEFEALKLHFSLNQGMYVDRFKNG
jgi:hypothetical protein